MNKDKTKDIIEQSAKFAKPLLPVFGNWEKSNVKS